MDHEAHIRLVDAHAERHRGAHGEAVLEQESTLALGAQLRVEPGMIGKRRHACLFQRFGQLLGPVAGGSIDDAAFALMRFDQRNHAV